MEKIRTYGNTCFVGGAVPSIPCASCMVAPKGFSRPISSVSAPTAKPKPEVVNLKFGKVRVQVKNATNVQVSEDSKSMTIVLSAVPAGHQEQPQES